MLDEHKTIWLNALKLFFKKDGFTDAGNMAFLTMLSLFPFLIFLLSLSGVLGQTARGEEAVAFLLEAVPPEVASALKGPIAGIIRNARPEILTGSIIFALWTAATGIEAARNILLKAFGREHARAIWVRRLESLALVIAGSVFLITAMSILVIGPALFSAATAIFPDDIMAELDPIWDYLNFLVSPLLLFVGIYGVYLALTPRRVKKASRLPGTILCLLFLLGTAKGLSIYLSYAGTYDLTYGSLAGVVITQLFCFIVALGFTLGAELNAVYTNHYNNQRKLKPKTDKDSNTD